MLLVLTNLIKMSDPTPSTIHYPENVQKCIDFLNNNIREIDDMYFDMPMFGSESVGGMAKMDAQRKSKYIKTIEKIKNAHKFITEQDNSSRNPVTLYNLYCNINNIMEQLENDICNVNTYVERYAEECRLCSLEWDIFESRDELIQTTLKDRIHYRNAMHTKNLLSGCRQKMIIFSEFLPKLIVVAKTLLQNVLTYEVETGIFEVLPDHPEYSKEIYEEINEFDVISHDLISQVMLSVGKIDNIDPI